MKPAKTFKAALVSLAALLLILTVSAALLVAFYPAEELRSLVTEKAENALGRKVIIKNIGYGFGGITLEEVTIHESDESSPVLASVMKANLRIALLSLLRLELDFNSIVLKKAYCNIVFNDQGESNIGRFLSGIKENRGSSFSAKISKIKLAGAVVTLANPPARLAPLAGTYGIDGTIIIGKTIDIRDATVKLPETRGTVRADIIVRDIKSNPAITGSVKLEQVSLPWAYRWGTGVKLPYNIVSGTITNLVATKQGISGNVMASSTLLNAPTVFSIAGFCSFDISNKTISIEKTRCGIGTSAFIIDYVRIPLGGKVSQFSVRNINASITDVAPLLRFIPEKLYGRVTGDLRNNGGLYSGTLTLIDVGYDPELKIISGIHATLSITDNIFRQSGIPFYFYGNPCALAVSSADASLTRLSINIGAERIVINSGTSRISRGSAPFAIPMEISGLINVASLQFNQYRIQNIQLGYLLSGSTVALPGFQFVFADGTITGSGSIALDQGAPRASLSLSMKNLLVQNAVAYNEKIRNHIFGVAQGKTRIDFEISDSLLDTARGAVEFTITRGKLADTGIQNGLGLLLSEMKYKLRDLEFNTIYGNMDIMGTTYRVHSFIFNADKIRLNITGTFNNKLIASPLNIKLEFTRGFIQDLPGIIALGINNYLKGEWYIIPFILNGDMMDGGNVKRAE